MIRFLFLLTLSRWLVCPACLAQNSGSSLSLGIESSRSWGVAQEGMARIPLTLRLTVPMVEELYFSVSIGYEDYLDNQFESIALTNVITDGAETFVLDQGQNGTFYDQAIAFAPGLRYSMPGGPEKLRLMIGVNALTAWFPGQSITREAGVTVTDDTGQTIRFSESRSVTWGMEGYGYGGEVVLALEGTVFRRMIVGIECGPSWFQRTMNTRQIVSVSGIGNMSQGQAPEAFFAETERGGGLVEINNFDFRFQGYVGLAL